jgi:glycosyltransferase involved in cell wall biosynthesis
MNKQKPKIAVITRTKNRAVLLARAAESVLGQKTENLVWVVVNDGGDKSDVETVVDDFRKKSDNDAVVIHNEISAGMEAASNIGIAASASDFIVIHDDDDSWEPGFLSNCVQLLKKTNSYQGDYPNNDC